MPSEAQNAASLIGRTIGGRYTIKATIGSGGMGHVYRASQAPINRDVAIKVLRVDLAHQEGVAERFKREARAASMIQHPNAITIFDFDQDGDILYLAMEFLSGETLRQRLRREPPMEIQEALDMFEAMAGALGAAHKVGVVHRDLKPDNIFLAKFDAVGQVVKVLDFGLAKLLDRAADNDGLVTEANLRLGTPRYMAPEQALGIQPIDSRCDVYALGLLLYEMLAQRAPFVGDDGMEVLAQRLRREAPRISTIVPVKNFSEQIDDLLASMLKRDRDQRPQDANVVLQKLRDIRKANQVFRAEESAPPEANPAMGGGRSHDGVRPVRPATAGAIPALRPGGPASKPAEAMVRLDQDDFPEKPTVVVDPGAVDSPAMVAAALGRSNPGMHAMGPPPPMPMQMPMSAPSSYAAAAASQMGVPPVVGQSGSVSPYAASASNVTLPSAGLSTERSQAAPSRRRTLLIVVAVIIIAVLAPVIALIVRSTSNRGPDDHGDTPGSTDNPTKKNPSTPTPPTPKDPEVKTPSDPPADPPPDKGPKKGNGTKKKQPAKGKPDGGKKPEAAKKGEPAKKPPEF